MGSGTREEIVEVFNALDNDLDRLCESTFDVFTTPERLRALERLERVARRAIARRVGMSPGGVLLALRRIGAGRQGRP